LLRNASWLLFKLINVKLEIVGRENIPNETFVVYANHKSNFDPFFIYYACHTKPITAVGKKELFKSHIMKVIGNTFKAVIMNREDDREAAKVPFYKRKRIKVYILKPITKDDYQGQNTTEIGTRVESLINQKVKEYE
ncbi:MAG: 1-acyl-sn-glycerol-3-phosphate acyltransferase, partial [Acholeplasmatales bacterium]|nr:1-acyl-sn-glycerol-3-phosphate acyltransferase [Acholeplasmatales bacterium]